MIFFSLTVLSPEDVLLVRTLARLLRRIRERQYHIAPVKQGYYLVLMLRTIAAGDPLLGLAGVRQYPNKPQ
jgi:hypothetical protein